MNTEQAKNLSLPDLLAKLGHQPVKILKNGRELWYPSPFRQELDPSFHISVGRLGFWIWKDFGDIGGTVIDFAMRYAEVSSVREALAFLDRYAGTPSHTRAHDPHQTNLFSFHQYTHREAVENFSADRQLELIEAGPIQNPAILSYLAGRGIPADLARRYLVEVKYRNTGVGKEFFGFGMLNQSGGYEVRVALESNKFKSALVARDITVIPGSDPAAGGTANLFEGMTDFLSFLVMQGKQNLPEDAIILHSLSSIGRTVEYLRTKQYSQVRTYFDNNPAGQKGTARMQAELGPVVVSYSGVFAPHVDLNDALRAMLQNRKGVARS